MRVGILSVLFHWYILSAWYKCLAFLSPLAKENRKVAWGWASLNNAVEKVLEERKKPKVMRKDNCFIGPEEAGRGGITIINEWISFGKAETFLSLRPDCRNWNGWRYILEVEEGGGERNCVSCLIVRFICWAVSGILLVTQTWETWWWVTVWVV